MWQLGPTLRPPFALLVLLGRDSVLMVSGWPKGPTHSFQQLNWILFLLSLWGCSFHCYKMLPPVSLFWLLWISPSMLLIFCFSNCPLTHAVLSFLGITLGCLVPRWKRAGVGVLGSLPSPLLPSAGNRWPSLCTLPILAPPAIKIRYFWPFDTTSHGKKSLCFRA